MDAAGLIAVRGVCARRTRFAIAEATKGWARLFGQPERRFQSAEIIRLARGGTGAVHRQLARLEAAGLVASSRSGNQKYYQASPASPIFDELRRLIVKTVGAGEPLRRALATLTERIKVAFVYGSVSKGSDTAGSDIDLMLVSDALSYPDLLAAVQGAGVELGRPVNPTVMTSREWRAKRARKDSFVARIAAQPKLFVIGSEDELA
jgi:predicted nucleotidyltransferase